MNLFLWRDTFTEHSSIGQLFVDGPFFCYTLEDRDRAGEPKVYGETCIPEGTYRVVIDESARFGRPMPHILDVPGFEGIRIHSGNTDKDTLGCVLLGTTKDVDRVGGSHVAFDLFYPKLAAALDAGEECWLEITSSRTQAKAA